MLEVPEIPKTPQAEIGYCAPAVIVDTAKEFGIEVVNPEKMQNTLWEKHVSDKTWGTQPFELVNMARTILPDSHIFAKDNWKIEEIKSILKSLRSSIILDIWDKLKRIDKVTNEEVTEEDGHYVRIKEIKQIDGDDYALIVDPSKDEIAQEGKYNLISTNHENVYFLPLKSLEELWTDTNKDGSTNYHWALAMLHPDDNSKILDELKNGK